MQQFEYKIFILLTAVVTLTFAWVLWPFSGAILWAIVLAVLFAPVNRRVVASMPGRNNVAALITLLIILVMVILPFFLIANLIFREAASVYKDIASGQIVLEIDVQGLRDLLPGWLNGLLSRIELPDAGALRTRLLNTLLESGQFLAGQAINIGQSTFHLVASFFVMLYLLFFLIRDGRALAHLIGEAMPLSSMRRRALFSRFAVTINAIVKGSIIVALVQGTLGALILGVLGIRAPVLWGTVMVIFALLPVVGTSLVWGPIAIYLLASGALWQGTVLLIYGFLVIGLVDNLLRPILIGKETRIPDYLVLISTLGGIAAFGPNGIVIGPVVAALFLAVWSLLPAAMREQANRDGDDDGHPN
ncbi:AI-2E family transporter [Sinorhizobium sp. NFACC03]|uniref:AI-2E family transporter n=1 Tax=Sinorhizobium sp. NFACC03 TaxID=1566295 RepID=UPI000881DE7A|nr:AI-2E family transporter [Sinorhizobium sp. NFACC03]SDA93738.1 Predicted PurR-regulated permease PerM [Sinorhizobium sp. NFACC03]